jgi:hypothetical protein
MWPTKTYSCFNRREKKSYSNLINSQSDNFRLVWVKFWPKRLKWKKKKSIRFRRNSKDSNKLRKEENTFFLINVSQKIITTDISILINIKVKI